MARITKLTLDGYKGQRAVEQLSGLDIFVGPNGAGKSSRPEGLSLALLGYVPGGPKQVGEIMKNAADDQMSVGLTLDTGFDFTRTFNRKSSFSRTTGEETVSFSESLDVVPSKGERTATDKKKRVEEELGDFFIHLDWAEFEAMSAARKREFLSEFVNGSDELTKDRVSELLYSSSTVQMLKQNNQEAYNITTKMINDCLATWIDGLSVDDGILAMLEWVKSQRTHWNAKRKDAAGAVRQLAEQKNKLAETDRNIAKNEEELSELETQLLVAEKEVARGEEIKKAFEKRKIRMEELKVSIADLAKELGPADTTELDKQIADIRQQITEVSFDTSDLDKQIEDANVELDKAEASLRITRDERSQLANQIATLKTAAASASKAGGLCVVSKLIKCDKDFTPFLDHVKAEDERIGGLLKSKSKEEAVAQEAVVKIKNQIATLNKTKSDTLKEAQIQQKKNDELRTQIANLNKQKVELENQAVLNAGKHDMHVAELDRLEHEPFSPVPDLEVTKLQIQGLRTQIATLKAQIKEQGDSRTTLINMQTSLLENKDAEHKYNAATTLVEELGPNGIQGEILKSGLEPLREKIQANFDILNIKYPFAFRTESERGREIFDFGWIKSGEFVSFDTLSTGERMMVLLAVLTALLQKGTAGVRLLAIDEFQSLDSNNFANTLKGLKALYDADKLDNILIAGVLPIAELDGWNVRVLGGQEEQAVAS